MTPRVPLAADNPTIAMSIAMASSVITLTSDRSTNTSRCFVCICSPRKNAADTSGASIGKVFLEHETLAAPMVLHRELFAGSWS